MTNVGTVNPKLTILLVLLFFALVVALVVLACLLSRARGEVVTIRQEIQRVTGRYKALQERSREAEETAGRLMCHIETAIATARKAVENTSQLALMSQQLDQLLVYEPLEELPADPDHAGTYR
jgi:hypothetical protein